MSGFTAGWLALREPADRAARNPGLIARLAAHLGARPARILDLGAGTGANVRALAPHLHPDATWALVDHDPALLRAAEAALGHGPNLRYVQADLVRDLEALLAPPPDLVTGSAFLDLCSAPWLDRLAAALPAGTALYMALSYDGTEAWAPAHAAEPAALAAFRAHQRRDKGFGPALGPDAAAHLARALARRGWLVETAPSPWRLGPAHRSLIAALADGAAEAVAETGALDAATLAAWHQARRQAARVEIGHTDLLALP
ncbi:MAG TPA: class I SAM-dependent methyltransferase [Paracoccaceae bacterium]|nr:class I SAM-dependent methyltransferase [Paracoccaceae bacterium]